MNSPRSLPPVEFCLRRMLGDLQNFAHREPVTTVAVAVGAGLLINMLPTKTLVGTMTVVGALFIRPMLLSLGVTKALELCCQKSSTQDHS